MTLTILLEYLLLMLILIAMEGILSADNALVLAIMVRPLPADERKKALFYGLVGAFILRFTALFLISFLATVWQMQALGAIYLLYISIHSLVKQKHKQFQPADRQAIYEEAEVEEDMHAEGSHIVSKKKFWLTVAKVEFADIAFAIDSILAAVALAITLPTTSFGHIGGLDTAQFVVIFTGGFIGLIIMRFAATIFVRLLEKRPGLETAAFMLVGWVGIKLAITTLSHEALGIIPAAFPHSFFWKVIFFGVMIGIALWGWFSSKPQEDRTAAQ